MTEQVAIRSCRECGGSVRETQEGGSAHRYSDDTWHCHTCWLMNVNETFDEAPEDYFGPACECCRSDLPHLEGLDGNFHRLDVRVQWVKTAIATLQDVPSASTSNALHDRVISLHQEIRSIELETGMEFSDTQHAARLEAAEQLADEAESLAAGIKGSEASEQAHEMALRIIATMAQWEAQGRPKGEEEDELVEEAEEAIARYWRVQGLDADAAETAAALEIGEARKG